MDKFTRTGQFEIKSAPKSTETRVVKLDQPTTPSVQDFSLPRILRDGEHTYSNAKSRFGALAATDPDRTARTRKDARFALSPLVREPLSVEEEERRAIEERVTSRVEAVAEDVKAKAAQQGYQDGLKKGYDEAYKKFQQDATGRLQQVDAFISECENAKEAIFKANERFLIELVYRIGRTVLMKELSTDREYVLRLAKELIERVGVRDNIRIKVSPSDLETIGMLKQGLEKALGEMKNLSIEANNTVQGGGCAVETEWNAIDASIETQLQGLYHALVHHNEQGGSTT